MDFKPNESQGHAKLQNATKLQLAKRQLNSIEEKFKKYKSKSRQHTERRSQDSRMQFEAKSHIYNSNRQDMHSLVPDLKQYFSFMMEKQNQSHLNNNQHKINSSSKQRFSSKSPNKLETYDRVLQQNEQKSNKRSIQQKLFQQKTQAINSLENFFTTKKQQLEAKISDMEQQKQKAIQDINLLKRNNHEVQSQIQFEKNMIFTDATQILKDKNKQIQQKIMRKRQAIENMKKEVEKAKRRKDQLKQNIQQCLKGNKKIILHQKHCQ